MWKAGELSSSYSKGEKDSIKPVGQENAELRKERLRPFL